MHNIWLVKPMSIVCVCVHACVHVCTTVLAKVPVPSLSKVSDFGEMKTFQLVLTNPKAWLRFGFMVKFRIGFR